MQRGSGMYLDSLHHPVPRGREHRVDSFRVEPSLFSAAPHGETC
jgi:hypothetical protein